MGKSKSEMERFQNFFTKLLDLSRSYIALAVSLGVIIFLVNLRFQNNIVQQDNYLGYAKAFSEGLKDLSYYDSRLYPGLPLSIFLLTKATNNFILSGYLMIIFSFIGSYTLLNKITKSSLNILPLIFPPIMLDMATIIANEYITIFLVLLVVYLIYNNKYSSASFVSGLIYWFRAAGSLVFFAFLLATLLFSKKNVKPKYLLYFFVPILMFVVFNNHFFGSPSPFYQLSTYRIVSPYGNEIGFIQVFKDIIRTLKWGQIGILVSGLFYLIFYIAHLVRIYFEHRKKLNLKSMFLITSVVFMSMFIFSYSFVPYLENFARYLTPMIPLFWILLYKKSYKNLFLMPALAISILVVLR